MNPLGPIGPVVPVVPVGPVPQFMIIGGQQRHPGHQTLLLLLLSHLL